MLSKQKDVPTNTSATLGALVSTEKTSSPFPKGATIQSTAANIMKRVSSNEQAALSDRHTLMTSTSIEHSSHIQPLKESVVYSQPKVVSAELNLSTPKTAKRSVSNIHRLLSPMDHRELVDKQKRSSSPKHEIPVVMDKSSKPDQSHGMTTTADTSMSFTGSSRSSSMTSSPQKKHNDVHKKRAFSRRSRTGCLTCRRRRIKCDEHRPFCHNCIKSHKICSGYAHVDAMIRSKILKAQSKAGEHAFRVPAASYSAPPMPSYVPPQYIPQNASFVGPQPVQWSYPPSSQTPGYPGMVPVTSPSYPPGVPGSGMPSTAGYVPVNVPQGFTIPQQQISQQQPRQSPSQLTRPFSTAPYPSGSWPYQPPTPANAPATFPRVVDQQQMPHPPQQQLQMYPPPYVNQMLDYQKGQELLQQQMGGRPAPGPQVFDPHIPQFQQMIVPRPPNGTL